VRGGSFPAHLPGLCGDVASVSEQRLLYGPLFRGFWDGGFYVWGRCCASFQFELKPVLEFVEACGCEQSGGLFGHL
jgi:hypothetical protein